MARVMDARRGADDKVAELKRRDKRDDYIASYLRGWRQPAGRSRRQPEARSGGARQ